MTRTQTSPRVVCHVRAHRFAAAACVKNSAPLSFRRRRRRTPWKAQFSLVVEIVCVCAFVCVIDDVSALLITCHRSATATAAAAAAAAVSRAHRQRVRPSTAISCLSAAIKSEVTRPDRRRRQSGRCYCLFCASV